MSSRGLKSLLSSDAMVIATSVSLTGVSVPVSFSDMGFSLCEGCEGFEARSPVNHDGLGSRYSGRVRQLRRVHRRVGEPVDQRADLWPGYLGQGPRSSPRR